MATWLIVSLVIPLVGAALAAGTAAAGHRTVRLVALAATLLTLLVAGYLVFQFPAADPARLTLEGAQQPEPFALWEAQWFGSPEGPVDIRFSLALDGLGVWLYGLSALLMLTAVFISWDSVTHRPGTYYALLLLLETGLLGVFTARDILLFYVFFEFTLLPLFFLIGIWGHEERRYAAVKFFLYTLAGSVLTFLGLLAIAWWCASQHPQGVLSFYLPAVEEQLRRTPMPASLQWWLFLALFAGFAVKVPLWPFHTWLPLAHVEAPTAGSVLLAGVLLKVGSYGFVRFCLPLLPVGSAAWMPWVMWLAVAGILYAALVALVQWDVKRLIAYSSVSHLGFCMLGVFAMNRPGLEGGVLQMVNHGLSTAGLFAVVGMIYARYHTRHMAELGGLARRLPLLSTVFLVLVLSSIGLPGLNGFAGEFLILAGAFNRGWTAPAGYAGQLYLLAALATLGVVLGAWYMLSMVRQVLFGPLQEPLDQEGNPPQSVPDLRWHELAAVAPLLVFVLWIGLQPGFFLRRMQGDLLPLADRATLNYYRTYAQARVPVKKQQQKEQPKQKEQPPAEEPQPAER